MIPPQTGSRVYVTPGKNITVRCPNNYLVENTNDVEQTLTCSRDGRFAEPASKCRKIEYLKSVESNIEDPWIMMQKKIWCKPGS